MALPKQTLLPHRPKPGLVGGRQAKDGIMLIEWAKWFIFGFWGTIALVVVIGTGRLIWRKRQASLKTKREFLDQFWAAYHRPPQWYYNIRRGIKVIVRADDHEQGRVDRHHKVTSGQIPASERIVIVVQPAFTFWYKPEARNYMQSGSESDFNRLWNDNLFPTATGFPRYYLTDAARKGWITYDDARDLPQRMLIPDPNLFVPFSSGWTLMSRFEQETRFPRYDLADVAEYLLHKTPLPETPDPAA